jgi:hypothetical protein
VELGRAARELAREGPRQRHRRHRLAGPRVGDRLRQITAERNKAPLLWGSAAAFSVQTSDASALVTLASSIRGSDAPDLCMRVLVAVSVTAWAGASTAAAGTARRAHVQHMSFFPDYKRKLPFAM